MLLKSSFVILLFGVLCFIIDIFGNLIGLDKYLDKLSLIFIIVLHLRIFIHLVYIQKATFNYASKIPLHTIIAVEGLIIFYFWLNFNADNHWFDKSRIEFLVGFWLNISLLFILSVSLINNTVRTKKNIVIYCLIIILIIFNFFALFFPNYSPVNYSTIFNYPSNKINFLKYMLVLTGLFSVFLSTKKSIRI